MDSDSRVNLIDCGSDCGSDSGRSVFRTRPRADSEVDVLFSPSVRGQMF